MQEFGNSGNFAGRIFADLGNHVQEFMCRNFSEVSIMCRNLGIPAHVCAGFYAKMSISALEDIFQGKWYFFEDFREFRSGTPQALRGW